MLFITGSAKAVYVLSCEFVNGDHHDITEN